MQALGQAAIVPASCDIEPEVVRGLSAKPQGRSRQTNTGARGLWDGVSLDIFSTLTTI
jgi:hypothetical protein